MTRRNGSPEHSKNSTDKEVIKKIKRLSQWILKGLLKPDISLDKFPETHLIVNDPTARTPEFVSKYLR